MGSSANNSSLELSSLISTTELPAFYADVSTSVDQAPVKLSRFNEGRFDLLVGNYVITWMEVIIVTILCGIMSTSGLVANAINVLVFLRQNALSSSSSVSLLALALADMGSLMPLLGNSINYAIFLLNKDAMPFLTPQDVTEVFFLWPHIMFMQISSWITVYIAFERCMSVVVPLKVKMIFSAKKSLIIVMTIATTICLSFVPIYATTRTEEMQDFDTNATKLIFSLTEDIFAVVDVSNIVQSIVLRILAVTIVFICTQITVYRVKLSTKWRTAISVAAPNNQPSAKIKKQTKASTNSSKFSETKSTNKEYLSGEELASSSSCPSTTTTATNTSISSSHDTDDNSPSITNPIKTKSATTTTVTTTTGSAPSHDAPVPAPSKNSVKTVAAATARERRLVRIITMISTIFMVCNVPEVAGIITLVIMENFYGISPWDNLIHMFTYLQFFFESINASINILVYYNMSTRYRQEFRQMFGLK